MAKIYLLLRNNQQYGPYTFAELLHQELTKNDLIWVEGKSTAWCHLDELEQILAKPSETEAKPINKPSPLIYKKREEIEVWAEELRKKTLSQTTTKPQNFQWNATESNGRNTGTVYMPEEKKINVVYHKRNAPGAHHIVVTVLAGCLIAASWYGDLSLFKRSTLINESTVKPIGSEAIIKTNFKPVVKEETAFIDPALISDSSSTEEYIKPVTQVNYAPKPLKEEKELPKIAIVTPVAESAVIKTEDTPSVKTSATVAKAEVKKEPVLDHSSELDDVTADKKKGLGNVIKNIFKKKKKDDDKDDDEDSTGTY